MNNIIMVFLIAGMLFSACKSPDVKNNSDNSMDIGAAKGTTQSSAKEKKGGTDYKKPDSTKEAELTGTVSVVGTGLFNEVILRTPEGEVYKVRPQYNDMLWQLQYHKIRIKCTVQVYNVVINGIQRQVKWIIPHEVTKDLGSTM